MQETSVAAPPQVPQLKPLTLVEALRLLNEIVSDDGRIEGNELNLSTYFQTSDTDPSQVSLKLEESEAKDEFGLKELYQILSQLHAEAAGAQANTNIRGDLNGLFNQLSDEEIEQFVSRFGQITQRLQGLSRDSLIAGVIQDLFQELLSVLEYVVERATADDSGPLQGERLPEVYSKLRDPSPINAERFFGGESKNGLWHQQLRHILIAVQQQGLEGGIGLLSVAAIEKTLDASYIRRLFRAQVKFLRNVAADPNAIPEKNLPDEHQGRPLQDIIPAKLRTLLFSDELELPGENLISDDLSRLDEEWIKAHLRLIDGNDSQKGLWDYFVGKVEEDAYTAPSQEEEEDGQEGGGDEDVIEKLQGLVPFDSALYQATKDIATIIYEEFGLNQFAQNHSKPRHARRALIAQIAKQLLSVDKYPERFEEYLVFAEESGRYDEPLYDTRRGDGGIVNVNYTDEFERWLEDEFGVFIVRYYREVFVQEAKSAETYFQDLLAEVVAEDQRYEDGLSEDELSEAQTVVPATLEELVRQMREDQAFERSLQQFDTADEAFRNLSDAQRRQLILRFERIRQLTPFLASEFVEKQLALGEGFSYLTFESLSKNDREQLIGLAQDYLATLSLQELAALYQDPSGATQLSYHLQKLRTAYEDESGMLRNFIHEMARETARRHQARALGHLKQIIQKYEESPEGDVIDANTAQTIDALALLLDDPVRFIDSLDSVAQINQIFGLNLPDSYSRAELQAILDALKEYWVGRISELELKLSEVDPEAERQALVTQDKNTKLAHASPTQIQKAVTQIKNESDEAGLSKEDREEKFALNNSNLEKAKKYASKKAFEKQLKKLQQYEENWLQSRETWIQAEQQYINDQQRAFQSAVAAQQQASIQQVQALIALQQQEENEQAQQNQGMFAAAAGAMGLDVASREASAAETGAQGLLDTAKSELIKKAATTAMDAVAPGAGTAFKALDKASGGQLSKILEKAVTFMAPLITMVGSLLAALPFIAMAYAGYQAVSGIANAVGNLFGVATGGGSGATVQASSTGAIGGAEAGGGAGAGSGSVGFGMSSAQAAMAITGSSVIMTTIAATTMQSAFLQPLPTFTDGEISPYVTITKNANPNNVEEPTTVDYKVTVAAKDEYTLEITSVPTDEFTLVYNDDEDLRSEPGPASVPESSSYDSFLRALEALEGARLSPGDTLDVGNYQIDFDDKYTHAAITNTFTLTFNVYDQSGQLVEENVQARSDAAVCFGECAFGEFGCFEFGADGTSFQQWGYSSSSIDWTDQNKREVEQAFSERMGQEDGFVTRLCSRGPVTLYKGDTSFACDGGTCAHGWAPDQNALVIYKVALGETTQGRNLSYTLAHELAHILDYRNDGLRTQYLSNVDQTSLLYNKCYSYSLQNRLQNPATQGLECFADFIAMYFYADERGNFDAADRAQLLRSREYAWLTSSEGPGFGPAEWE